MKEIKGNIFDQHDADAICCPTNGIVKADGCLVMGKGLAKQFADRYPKLPAHFGKWVKQYGNTPCLAYLPIGSESVKAGKPTMPVIISFPTKDDYRNNSSLKLIKQSAELLVRTVTICQFKKVVLSRVGCGLGQLQWEQVKAVLEPILDDRFYIITPEVK